MTEHDNADQVLHDLLRRHPDAVVAAVDAGGLFVTMPESIEVASHRIPQARSALDLVVSEDRVRVIDAWARAREEGQARLTVRPTGADGALAMLHIIDVTSTHGTFASVLVPLAGSASLDEAVMTASAPPRLVRMRKSELSELTEVDDDVTAVLGWKPAELVGHRSLEFVHPDDQTQAIDAWMEVMSKPGATGRCRFRHLHKDGRWVWVEVSNTNLLDAPDGGYIGCDMFDISEEMDALEAVRASEQLFRRLALALPVGVVQIDANRRLVYANDELYRIFGAGPDQPAERLMQCVISAETLRSRADGRGDHVRSAAGAAASRPAPPLTAHPLSAALDDVLGGSDTDIEMLIDRVDGSGRRRCTVALRALTSPLGEVTGAVGSISDITEAARMQAELEQRATYDPLTGCVNRSTTMAQLDAALAAPDEQTAVVFIDLDGFKAVNDEFGHAAGDTLLVAVANRLRTVVRAGDVVGRIGGDEFLVICPDVPDAQSALGLAERLAGAVRGRVHLGAGVHDPSASVGVAWTPEREGADALIAQADDAMYAAKRAGGGRAVLAGDGGGLVAARRPILHAVAGASERRAERRSS